MASNTGFLSTSELDFDSIKSNLKTYLKAQDRFADYNFDGSNMSVLLDVLSYNTYLNAHYLNQVGSEMFLDTAQLKESVVSHAKELNYLPRSRTSSRAYVDITIAPTGTPTTITIPKYYKATTFVDGTTYTFSTNEELLVSPENGIYTAANVAIYEGNIVTEYFYVTNTSPYILKSTNIDTNSIEVTIITSNTNSTNAVWQKAESLYSLDNYSNNYFLQGYAADQYQVVFGDGNLGRKPTDGNIVKVIYRDTLGEGGNGSYIFRKTNFDGYTNITITTNVVAAEGSERESIDSIKYNAPRYFTTQERGVTATDFVTLTKAKYPQLQAVSAYGGEELTPPQYGKVAISVKPYGSTGKISDSLKREIVAYLTLKSLTTEPIIVDPEFFYVSIVSKVYFNINNTTNTTGQITSYIKQNLIDFGTNNLVNFGDDLRYSKMLSVIDSADDSIKGNDTDIYIIKRWSPVINKSQTLLFTFDNELYNEDILYELPNGHELTLRSSTFTYLHSDGNTYDSYIGDNGLGAIHVYTNQLINGIVTRKILNSNIGTVNVYTGEVLFTVTIQSYNGSYISIYATTKNKDLVATKNKFLIIEGSDISLTLVNMPV